MVPAGWTCGCDQPSHPGDYSSASRHEYFTSGPLNPLDLRVKETGSPSQRQRFSLWTYALVLQVGDIRPCETACYLPLPTETAFDLLKANMVRTGMVVAPTHRSCSGVTRRPRAGLHTCAI